MTKIHLGAIRRELMDLLDHAQTSIKVGMAWLTNEALFTLLVNKAEERKAVSVIISDSPANFFLRGTQQRKLEFSRLTEKRGDVRVAETMQNKFFHNKYAIIDERIVITGSYNWSNAAEANHENIILTDDTDVVRQFNTKHRYFVENVAILYETFMHRLVPAVGETRREEKIDDENYKLAKEFEYLVQKNISTATLEGLTVNLNKLQAKIIRYTAVGAARELSNAPEQSGFLQLAEMRRLDLSFESLVIKPKFKPLFDSETIENAWGKLKKYEFKTKSDEPPR